MWYFISYFKIFREAKAVFLFNVLFVTAVDIPLEQFYNSKSLTSLIQRRKFYSSMCLLVEIINLKMIITRLSMTDVTRISSDL